MVRLRESLSAMTGKMPPVRCRKPVKDVMLLRGNLWGITGWKLTVIRLDCAQDAVKKELRLSGMNGMKLPVKNRNHVPGAEKMKVKLIIIDAGHEAFGRDALPHRPPRYFTDPKRVSHIDAWRYSPAVCPRVIETSFA